MKWKVYELPKGEEKHAAFEISSEQINEMLHADAKRDQLEASLFSAQTPIQLDAWLTRNEEDVFFRAKAAGALRVVCVRCLEEYTLEIPFELTGLFCPQSEDGAAADIEDESQYIYKHDEIDPTDAIREHLFLSLPLNPVCREDCAGLCPSCGINRNRETCVCKQEHLDSRFEKLRLLHSQRANEK